MLCDVCNRPVCNLCNSPVGPSATALCDLCGSNVKQQCQTANSQITHRLIYSFCIASTHKDRQALSQDFLAVRVASVLYQTRTIFDDTHNNMYTALMQVLPGCQESRWLARRPPKQAQVRSQCICCTTVHAMQLPCNLKQVWHCAVQCSAVQSSAALPAIASLSTTLAHLTCQSYGAAFLVA